MPDSQKRPVGPRDALENPDEPKTTSVGARVRRRLDAPDVSDGAISWHDTAIRLGFVTAEQFDEWVTPGALG